MHSSATPSQHDESTMLRLFHCKPTRATNTPHPVVSSMAYFRSVHAVNRCRAQMGLDTMVSAWAHVDPSTIPQSRPRLASNHSWKLAGFPLPCVQNTLGQPHRLSLADLDESLHTLAGHQIFLKCPISHNTLPQNQKILDVKPIAHTASRPRHPRCLLLHACSSSPAWR